MNARGSHLPATRSDPRAIRHPLGLSPSSGLIDGSLNTAGHLDAPLLVRPSTGVQANLDPRPVTRVGALENGQAR